MPSKKILALWGIVIGILIALTGGYVYAHSHDTPTTQQTFAVEGKAALSKTVNGMRVPGILVSPSWQIASTQQASALDQLPSQLPIKGQVQAAWCVSISPAVTVQRTKKTPTRFLQHFLVIQSSVSATMQWTALTIDGDQLSQGVAIFTQLGCTNG